MRAPQPVDTPDMGGRISMARVTILVEGDEVLETRDSQGPGKSKQELSDLLNAAYYDMRVALELTELPLAYDQWSDTE